MWMTIGDGGKMKRANGFAVVRTMMTAGVSATAMLVLFTACGDTQGPATGAEGGSSSQAIATSTSTSTSVAESDAVESDAPESEAADGSTEQGDAAAAADGSSGVSASRWSGTWQSAGESLPATLTVITDRPMLATIDIPGRCGATWKESARRGGRPVVDATVTYGQCNDNQWLVSVNGSTLTAVDTANSGTTVRFTRQ
ncbi:hypothetical protein GS4_14_00230 [Gordonia soli NBRC 108243]|uniref:Uncharacterized protein n=2 Tax=Gordonia soli TaxID=320799 RepID=M0QIB7_9ACTN|nr:hypothetical protein GS4_14_00230 [Gordonia soli NBRC 108243]